MDLPSEILVETIKDLSAEEVRQWCATSAQHLRTCELGYLWRRLLIRQYKIPNYGTLEEYNRNNNKAHPSWFAAWIDFKAALERGISLWTAALNGWADMVYYKLAGRTNEEATGALIAASLGGHLALVRHLSNITQVEFDDDADEATVEKFTFFMLSTIIRMNIHHNQQLMITSIGEATSAAAIGNHVDVLEYLVDGISTDESIFNATDHALLTGQAEALQFLIANNEHNEGLSYSQIPNVATLRVVIPYVQDFWPIQLAALRVADRTGDISMIELLWQIGQFDPLANSMELLRQIVGRSIIQAMYFFFVEQQLELSRRQITFLQDYAKNAYVSQILGALYRGERWYFT